MSKSKVAIPGDISALSSITMMQPKVSSPTQAAISFRRLQQ